MKDETNVTTTENGNVSAGKVKINTITRLVVLILALVNNILAMFGVYANLGVQTEIVDVVSMLIVVAAALWCYWKDNAWTENAKICDFIFDALKRSDLTIDDIADIIKKVAERRKIE